MTEEEKNNSETEAQVAEETLTEEERKERTKQKNVEKIGELIKELNRIKQKGGPDIRICPRCFSLKVKEIDIIKKMGIGSSYPVCVCQDCGWRSNKWIYLDRTMTEEEREKFFNDSIIEKMES
ncbi:MAG: hypothetical protein ACFFDW_15225 [Candidatus Thorarchaeota archaeon]